MASTGDDGKDAGGARWSVATIEFIPATHGGRREVMSVAFETNSMLRNTLNSNAVFGDAGERTSTWSSR